MESGGQAIAVVGKGPMYPVFRGLAEAKFPGTEIAEIVGVAPPTYSKWRTGKSKVPSAKMVFLTLLLANRIEELEGGDTGNRRFEVSLKSIHRHLRRQETINCTLHPGAVREGARLFRQWWRDGTDEEAIDGSHDLFDRLSHAMMAPAPSLEIEREGAPS